MDDIQRGLENLALQIQTLSTQFQQAQANQAQLNQNFTAQFAAQAVRDEDQAPAPPNDVEVYNDVTLTLNAANDISLDVFKTLPEFNGERKRYATWRSMVKNTIGFLDNHKNSSRYVEALTIIRNKITGSASNVLSNYNTAFNFDAIINRLDFTYVDKRPLHILEQELMILQQGKLTMDEFYDLVNEKLNAIVNKINLTYNQPQTTQAFIDAANERALRTFITGLNNRKGEILYAANPSTLPEAYTRLQTIIYDQERIVFANQHNFGAMRNQQSKPSHQANRNGENSQNGQRPGIQQNWRDKLENSQNNVKSSNHQNWRGRFENSQNVVRSSNRAEAMDIDKTSTAVNIDRNAPFKRDLSKNNSRMSYEQANKIQRLNNVEGEPSSSQSVDHGEHAVHDDFVCDEFDDEIFPSDETSSAFLGN